MTHEGARRIDRCERDACECGGGRCVDAARGGKPDGSEWTNQKIADAVFKHTITEAS